MHDVWMHFVVFRIKSRNKWNRIDFDDFFFIRKNQSMGNECIVFGCRVDWIMEITGIACARNKLWTWRNVRGWDEHHAACCVHKCAMICTNSNDYTSGAIVNFFLGINRMRVAQNSFSYFQNIQCSFIKRCTQCSECGMNIVFTSTFYFSFSSLSLTVRQFKLMQLKNK